MYINFFQSTQDLSEYTASSYIQCLDEIFEFKRSECFTQESRVKFRNLYLRNNTKLKLRTNTLIYCIPHMLLHSYQVRMGSVQLFTT